MGKTSHKQKNPQNSTFGLDPFFCPKNPQIVDNHLIPVVNLHTSMESLWKFLRLGERNSAVLSEVYFMSKDCNREILLYTEVSSFQGLSSTVYRGVLISGGWNRGVQLYTEVSSFQVVGIEEFHCIQRCPHFRWLE